MVEVISHTRNNAPDVYFTEDYGRLDAASVKGDWNLFTNGQGSWQMPLVLNEIDGSAREASSPYGYSGIWIDPNLSSSEAVDTWCEAMRELKRLGVVSLFLRFSPLDPYSAQLAGSFPRLEMQDSGRTYLVRINGSEGAWDAMEGRARTAVRKARRKGMSSIVRDLQASDVTEGAPFRRLYERTMERVHASSRYFFDDVYYEKFVNITTAETYIAEVYNSYGEVVAASLVMRHGTKGHYHLSGSEGDAARDGANALMVWSILEWCADVGISECHLGGGVTEDDGLAKFKRSFGGTSADFLTGCTVIDSVMYQKLTEQRADELGTTLDALANTAYFPAFRANIGPAE